VPAARARGRVALAARYRRRRRSFAAPAAPAASRGPCVRAILTSCLRCSGGSRRQMSHAAIVRAHGVGRSLRNARAMPQSSQIASGRRVRPPAVLRRGEDRRLDRGCRRRRIRRRRGRSLSRRARRGGRRGRRSEDPLDGGGIRVGSGCGVRHNAHDRGSDHRCGRDDRGSGGWPRGPRDRRGLHDDPAGTGRDGDAPRVGGCRQEAGDQHAPGDGDPEQEDGETPLQRAHTVPLSSQEHPVQSYRQAGSVA
jgi:hypothetical protein